MLFRAPQRQSPFAPGDPSSGYYNDLTMKATAAGSPDAAVALAHDLIGNRSAANPVTVAQLGLGAWQLSRSDPRWLETVDVVVSWATGEMETNGSLAYQTPMLHTYSLPAPWSSAMAQGELASLFVRAAPALSRPQLLDRAQQAVAPLLDPASPLVTTTPEGTVLQEYPTHPPADVLNGWIFALWGLYDVGVACSDEKAEAAAMAGFDTLAARLPLYETPWRWSRYDLYPHRLVHVASPFYHRLHVAQLRATHELTGDERLLRAAARWQSAMRNPVAIGIGVTRKVAFRLLEPRRQRAKSRVRSTN